MYRIYYFQWLIGLGLYLTLMSSAMGQKTYPVFPNILDHKVADGSTLLGASGNRLVYFDVVSNKDKLWISDGTANGTKLVSPANQTEIQVFYHDTNAWYFTERRGSTYYISKLTNDNDTLEPVHSSGIKYQNILYWKGKFSWIQNSAGSGYSRMQLFDPVEDTLITLVNLPYLSVRTIGASDSLLFYIASTNTGKMLGSSEGTLATTKFITTLFAAGSDFDQQSRFFSNGKKVYFFYHPEPDPFVLWTTDGTASGTIQLGSFQDPDFGWPDDPVIFLEDKLFFILRELGAPSGTTYELNVSDGTPLGTLTLDNYPNDYTQPSDLTLFNTKIYFVSYEWGADMRESDGTLAGTKIILDSYGHENGGIGFIGALGKFNNSLVLQGYEDVHGAELYSSDGTKSGTTLLSDVIRGSVDGAPKKFTQVGDRLFFTARYGGKERLWIYDPGFDFNCDSMMIDTLESIQVTDSTLGSINISMTGGQQPYVFSLNGGSNTYNAEFKNLNVGVYNLHITDNLGCSLDTTLTVSESTSIIDPVLIRSMTIQPNPSELDQNVNVRLSLTAAPTQGSFFLTVYSMDGKLYHHDRFQISSSGIERTIATKDWPKGQYILSVKAGNSVLASEILIIL